MQKKQSGKVRARKRRPSSFMLRVRISAQDHKEMMNYVDENVSDYIRHAALTYGKLVHLAAILEEECTARALSTFECNFLAIFEPDVYLTMEGAELTKPPEKRRRPKDPVGGLPWRRREGAPSDSE
jgi:hypothetical protein